jgi:GNAT superfamily N-acetyltransferase
MPNPEYEIRARVPSKIPLRDLSRCIKIVRTGNAVDPDSASAELPHSKILAFALAGGHIVGVGAIKRRRPAYARQIAERSGASFDPNTLELGYVAVEPNHRGRGLSELIVQELLTHHLDSLFATTSSEHMKRTLTRVGFAERGNAWLGRNGDQLSLWLKESTVEASAGEE